MSILSVDDGDYKVEYMSPQGDAWLDCVHYPTDTESPGPTPAVFHELAPAKEFRDQLSERFPHALYRITHIVTITEIVPV